MEHAEASLQSLVKARQEGNKVGKLSPASRQAIVADALVYLAKREVK